MASNTLKSCAGGKGNRDMFIERDPKVCAAGRPSSQSELRMDDFFRQYCLQDEVDALIQDSIAPPPKPRLLPPLRRQPLPDMRNAGPFSEAAQLINPPFKTKFETLVDDFKNTAYKSYWKQPVGSVPDPVPTLPRGFDTKGTTFGKKTPDCGRLYDTVMPVNPLPDKTRAAKCPGYQTNRNYCRPSYNPETFFGQKTPSDLRGRSMKCCLTDDRVHLGTLFGPITSRLADFQFANQARLGVPLAPYDNISNVPPGYAFGVLKPPDNLPECLTTCKMNPSRDHFKKCLGHLNSLRKCLKKRFDGPYFKRFYLELKYFDKTKSGWLPKDTIYNVCRKRYIIFNQSLIEPILTTWNAFDGKQIEYNTFVLMLNHTQPSMEFPKVWDIDKECIDFRTTYSEMVKPGQDNGKRLMAGLPSGRYLDLDYPITPAGFCKADRIYLSHESDSRSCLSPSIFTNLGVSHRDMYAKRLPEDVRKVFEAASSKAFSDEQFDAVWEKAKTFHSQGLVSYETFRRAMDQVPDKKAKAIL